MMLGPDCQERTPDGSVLHGKGEIREILIRRKTGRQGGALGNEKGGRSFWVKITCLPFTCMQPEGEGGPAGLYALPG